MVLSLRGEAPIWDEAKCLVTDPHAPIEAYDIPFEDQLTQQSICNGEDGGPVCPLRHECLIFALQNNLEWGIWGGVSETGRKQIRKEYPMNLKTKEVRKEWEWRPSQAKSPQGDLPN